MLFTTKTEYGMRAMVALAKNKTKEPLSLAQIAKTEHISQAYLERLFAKLKADGLVVSAKGVKGGYLLALKPKEVSIFDIVEALEGAVAVFQCVASDHRKITCTHNKCLTKRVWYQLQGKIIKTLREFTLSDLI